MKKLITGFLLLWLLLGCMINGVAEECVLRGFDENYGYVYVLFGKYSQSIDGGEFGDTQQSWRWRLHYSKHKGRGKNKESGLSLKNIDADPILWRVLSVDEERVYLCSEYILFASELDPGKKDYETYEGWFKETKLWRTLNKNFINTAFTKKEIKMLYEDKDYGRVYLLGTEDLNNRKLGFGTNKRRKAWSTEVAIRMYGTYVYSTDSGCNSPYWTRKTSSHPGAGICIKKDGSVGYYSCMYKEQGVRPVINLKPDSYEISSGSGTKDDPYVIVPAQ